MVLNIYYGRGFGQMKRLIIVSAIYFVIAEVVIKVLFRAFEIHSEKFLNSLHTNIMLFGFFSNLILAILDLNFKICEDKGYKSFYIIYNISFIIRIIILGIEYATDKVNLDLDSSINIFACIIMIISSLGIAYAFVKSFLILKRNINEERLWYYKN